MSVKELLNFIHSGNLLKIIGFESSKAYSRFEVWVCNLKSLNSRIPACTGMTVNNI